MCFCPRKTSKPEHGFRRYFPRQTSYSLLTFGSIYVNTNLLRLVLGNWMKIHTRVWTFCLRQIHTLLFDQRNRWNRYWTKDIFSERKIKCDRYFEGRDIFSTNAVPSINPVNQPLWCPHFSGPVLRSTGFVKKCLWSFGN